ncbi:MAG: hypothetical protein MI863_16450 [Desulfobacterales bacterium]|nr:hypothetical protein [Desulfobacterales bacterium]
MNHRPTSQFFTPNRKRPQYLTVMVCPESKCSHVWEASNTGNPCPICGNKNVIPASNWDLDGAEVLKLGKLPGHLPEKGVCNEK